MAQVWFGIQALKMMWLWGTVKRSFRAEYPQVYLVNNGRGQEYRNGWCTRPVGESDQAVIQTGPGHRVVVRTPHKQCSTSDVVRSVSGIPKGVTEEPHFMMVELEDEDGDRIDISEHYEAVSHQIEDGIVTFHHMLLPHTERIFEMYRHMVVTDDEGEEWRQENVRPETVVWGKKKIITHSQ